MNIYIYTHKSHMKELSNFKNHLVFDSKFKSSTVNTLVKSLEDYNHEDDKALCRHCFFGGNSKVPFLKNIVSMPSKRKTPRNKNRAKIKKSKTYKKKP